MTIPTKLGKYDIRRELGQGAMGVVYEGFDPMIGRRVALKTVKRDQLESTEANEILARFRREAQAAGRMTHPNIVAIYEYGEDQNAGGIAFIAMEFVEGRELKDYFDCEERFPLPEIVRIMGQLLDALDYSHRQGVVHRDIKPANIILLADGTVKVADFGIARIESSNLTQAGSVLGTPSYMSPEQFMGQTVDGRSDLFSAGVVLYQFLTGEKPFTGALTTIMHKVLKEEPPAPSVLNVQVPRLFDAIVRRALAKRPDERFQTAREFAAALRGTVAPAEAAAAEATMAVGSDGTLLTRDAAAGQPPADSVTMKMNQPVGQTPAASPPATRPRSQAPAVAIVAGIAVVGVAVLGYYFLAGRGGQPAAIATQSGESRPIATAPVSTAPTIDVQPATEPGTMVISALGLADPSDPRYQSDKNSLQIALREDARRQLVEKAIALYVDQKSIDQNYGLLRDRLLARSGEFVQAVIDEQPIQTGKDGLVSISTRATVRVRDVQKSLNQMSRDERVEFIRNNGDPRIAVAITVANDDGGVSVRSPVAENLLKERIQSFGFRIANDDIQAKQQARGADFSVQGEARFKKLSARLAASGITIEKTVLTSWTVKCTDKSSGEEIYHNTKIPEGKSWASQEKALADIGQLIGEEFSKSFFLQHFDFSAQPVKMSLSGLPSADAGRLIVRELTGLRSVLHARPVNIAGSQAEVAVLLSGGASDVGSAIKERVLDPINQKLGRQCLALSAAGGNEVSVGYDATCQDAAVLSRLESIPPAGLITAPEPRRQNIVKNPDTLRKLTI